MNQIPLITPNNQVMVAHKTYNRNASSLEDTPPRPTYSESLLFQKGFRFQKRHQEDKIDLRTISKVDIERVVKNVDLEVLQGLLENITYGDLSEDDFDLYSSELHHCCVIVLMNIFISCSHTLAPFADDCFVKLFQINQLTLEYLLDVQDTLSANLNGLAKKYAAKKREVGSLSQNLARQDVEVATLRDELHHIKELMRNQQESPTAVATFDPSLYPSQEKREEAGTGVVEENVEDAIQLHIISSIHGMYLSLSVCPSITVQDVMKQLTEQLPDDSSSALWCITFKGQCLNDPTQSLDNVGIDATNNSIVLEMKARNDNPPMDKETQPSAESHLPEQTREALFAQMEELVSTAKMAHEELIEGSRALQHQALVQDEQNESVLAFLGTQMQGLEVAIRDEIQRSMSEAVIQFSKQARVSQSNDVFPEASEQSVQQLNIGDIESDDGGEDYDTNDNQVDTDIAAKVKEPSSEEAGKSKIDLWVDTKAEYGGPLCESKLSDAESPSSLECPSKLNASDHSIEDVDKNGVFPLPNAYSLVQSEGNKSPSESRPPTPSRDSLLNKEPKEDDSTKDGATKTDVNLAPSLDSMPTPPSLKKIHSAMVHFSFSGYESEDCVSVDVSNQTHDSNSDFSKICGFAPIEITSGVSQNDIACDLEMQSIEVSPSKFQDVPNAKFETDVDESNCLGRKRSSSKRMSFKNMLPRWRKSKEKKTVAREKGRLYSV
jgi:hypothetical protein